MLFIRLLLIILFVMFECVLLSCFIVIYASFVDCIVCIVCDVRVCFTFMFYRYLCVFC